MAKGVVKGSKVVSVRKAPWDPLCDVVVKEVKKGDTVVVDPNHTVYDWKGHEYYPFVSNRIQNGYIRKDAVQLTKKGG